MENHRTDITTVTIDAGRAHVVDVVVIGAVQTDALVRQLEGEYGAALARLELNGAVLSAPPGLRCVERRAAAFIGDVPAELMPR